MSNPSQDISVLFHPAFNEPIEGVVSISFRQWDHGIDLQIQVDEMPILSIPLQQLEQFKQMLGATV